MTSMLPGEGEHLTTGWEPDLPAEDSLVRQATLAHVSWVHAIADAARGRTVDLPGWGGGSGGGTTPWLNWALVKQPPSDWVRIVDEVNDFIPGEVPYFLVSPFPTPDLRPLGLALIGHPPLMLRPAGALPTALPSGLDVRRVTGPEELLAAERVLVEGYPLPELADAPPGQFYRSDFIAGSTQVFVAYDGGSAIATSAAHSAAGVTVVENVAVLGSARGKGAGAAITWAATNAWPDQSAMLLASDEGQPVYQRLGYLRLVRWTCWLRPS